jgi:hypothetical protein
MQHSGNQPIKTKRTKRPKKSYQPKKHNTGDSAKVKREQSHNDLLLDNNEQ